MKKYFKSVTMCLAMALLMSSCIGSFGLTNKLKNWNDGLGGKFVNEAVFLVLHIVPVYEIAILADALVLNSIEFWSGGSALGKAGDTKIVKNGNGEDITVTTLENGYNLSNGDVSMNLVFDEADNSWAMEYNNQVNKLIKFTDDDKAELYLLNGGTMDVTLDEEGINMARSLMMANYALK